MEKQFVPYEIAKTLKEKGFDEPCLAMYNSERDLIGYTLTNPKTGGVLQDDVKVPLYKQVVDWLHKKHNLFLCVDIFKVSASDTSGYRYTWSTADLETEKWVEDETILGYLTPEEAWDKCIEESLKQI